MLIVMVKIFGEREPMACVAPHFQDNKRTLYAEGRLAPRYPMPSTLGEVFYLDRMILVEDADSGFDPSYTYDTTNGLWPTDSPNARVNWRG